MSKKTIPNSLVLLLSFSLLAACEKAEKPEVKPEAMPTKAEASSAQDKMQQATNPIVKNNFEEVYNSFDLDFYKANVKILASDDFTGREPATEGGKKTTDFITEQFKNAGLMPGNGDSYLQQVPLISIEADANMELTLGDEKLKYFDEFVAGTSKSVERAELKDSELVFVGYGVVAPEYGWNDYAGIDMKGKTAVILVNDPGFMTEDPELFQGRTMTYYGRWTYKYEEAGRQGAAGAIIVHDTAPASYGWGVVSNSWSGAQYQLADAGDEPKPDVEAWITLDKAKALFKRAGLDFEKEQAKALTREFQPVALDQTASVAFTNSIKRSQSANVIATLKGSEKPEEHVIYMGHWDHLGLKAHFEGDQIFNGAIDNATGIAGIISIAKAFNDMNIKPKRSVTFMAITAEEQGLLGSKYFAANPTVATKNIVGAFNIDSMNVSGRVNDLTVVGFGKSELEQYVTKAAKRQNRVTKVEADPSRGGYYRSDHFSLAKKGVPAIFAGGGSDFIEADKAMAEKWNALRGKCYHQLCDEYQEGWAWNAAMQDVKILFEAGYLLSTDNNYPNWYKGTEFKAIRDKDRQ